MTFISSGGSVPAGGSRRIAAAIVTGGGVEPPNVPGLSFPPIRLAAYPRQVAGLSRLSTLCESVSVPFRLPFTRETSLPLSCKLTGEADRHERDSHPRGVLSPQFS